MSTDPAQTRNPLIPSLEDLNAMQAQREAENEFPSEETKIENLRARFFAALLEAEPQFREAVCGIYHRFEFGTVFLFEETFLECLSRFNLPQWGWFSQMAKIFLVQCEMKSRWIGEGEERQIDKSLPVRFDEKSFAQLHELHGFKLHEFTAPAWDPRAETEDQFRERVKRRLEEYTAQQRGRGPLKVAAYKSNDDERLLVTAHVFFGRNNAEIKRLLNLDKDRSYISRTAKETCQALGIDPPRDRRGRPSSK